jgi:hypothetical protein
MALNVWTQPSGYNLGTFQEQVTVNIALPVSSSTEITFALVSGKLPSGLFLEGAYLVGAPLVVANNTVYTFCVRATDTLGNISDRTFTLTDAGFNPPIFLTPPGLLPIGPSQQFYALDQTYVSYQIQVSDLNVVLGDNLTFSILDGDGVLPPGLTLSPSGLISGFIAPAPSIKISDGSGNFDMSTFDKDAFDYGLRPTNGFDSYSYDTVIFDYYTATNVSQTLSLNYQFKITVTDGYSYSQQIFKIFVAGTDELRADSLAPDGLMDSFTADSTYIRSPQWLTNASLGTFRSNNYLTVPIALYNSYQVEFRLEATNHEVYAVSYQLISTDNILGSTSICIINVSTVPIVGQYFTLNYYVTGATSQLYQITQVTYLTTGRYRLTINTPVIINIPNNIGFYIGSLSTLPVGVNFDANTGDIYGFVPYQPAITTQYTFTLNASRPGDTSTILANSSKTFNIIILGAINSVITWQSPTALGTITADYICTLNVIAVSSVPGAIVNYSLVSVPNQSLPPGITLSTSGELLGVVSQFPNPTVGSSGLITFDVYSSLLSNSQTLYRTNYVNDVTSSQNVKPTTFDQGTTTLDRSYTFTINAADQYGYSAISKQFTVSISTPNTVEYNNIVCKPYLTAKQRSSFSNFINNPTIFPASSIYRPNDTNFGIQQNLTMLVYAGIQNTAAAAYISAMGLNVKKKRFYFGNIETAVAYDPVTNNAVYEVVYIQMIDPENITGAPLFVKTKSNEPETITVDNAVPISAILPDYMVTVDSTGYSASNSNTDKYFINNVNNWQTRFSQVGLSERNYLPLWMRSIQTGSKAQLGYVLAVPLCFCKVGTSSTILNNIQYISGFDFKTLDYTVDRFTITSLAGYISDKYLIFKNNRITV